MNLSNEKAKAKKLRNENVRNDFLLGMSRKAIASRYKLSYDMVAHLCNGLTREPNREEPELTEAEKRIKERLNNSEGNLNLRDFSIPRFGFLEPLITVQPKRRYR